MKRTTIFFIFIFFLSVTAYPENWEFGMQVLNSAGDPIQLQILLYESNDIINVFRWALSYDGWDPQYHTVNFCCDVGDDNTAGAYWDPIDPGEYRLRIGDRYIALDINEVPQSSGDFVIRYQDDEFILVYNGRGVTISETRDWDYPIVFEQKEEDGTTNAGTVAIWNGSSFNERYSPPHSMI